MIKITYPKFKCGKATVWHVKVKENYGKCYTIARMSRLGFS